ncbi:MAG: phosphoenolpyruvate--protein phosphotransferase [Trueperaceae bacterium]
MKETSVIITNPTGLHARPAVKLAQLASSFNANVQLRLDNGDWIKAKSVAKVMKLKATENTLLYLRAEGDDADEAIQTLLDFVNRDFDEGPRAHGHAHLQTNHAVANGSKLLATVEKIPLDNTTLHAEVASTGIAIGKLYHLQKQQLSQKTQGTAEQEKARLDKAISEAQQQLKQLSENAGGLSSEIIALQLELLNDSDFLSLARDFILQGNSALNSWENLLEQEMLEYQLSTDEYFKGRAADLRDLQERVSALLTGTAIKEVIPEDSIIVTDELTPSKFLELDWNHLAGAVTMVGSYTAHVSMLARSKGVPFLIGMRGALPNGVEAIILAEEKGMILLEPDAATKANYEAKRDALQQDKLLAQAYLSRPAQTAKGKRLQVYINVDDPNLLASINVEDCDGIGLTRTEFLFYGRSELPDEEMQYNAYRQLLEWAQGRPVTIRTLDAGGDKPISGYTMAENNPFLGVRGLRLSLAKSDVFNVQLRALARVAVHGNLKVMFPMVSISSELEQAKQLFKKQVVELQNANIPCAMPKLGMMVEVPAAALTVASFDADFYSIGSNDLIQYVMAAGRDTSGLSYLQNGLNPAVLELIERVARHGTEKGLEVSVCGEMASQLNAIPALLKLGIKTLSVASSSLANVKLEISRFGGR